MKHNRLTHPYQWLDWLYLQTSRGKLFTDGWGDTDIIDLVTERSVQVTPPVEIDIELTSLPCSGDRRCYAGQFISPVTELPAAVRLARFCLVTPNNCKPFDGPLCVSMPGSGDEGYERRLKTLAEPLLAQGISSLILENPFYGSRRPDGQLRSNIRTVSDFMLMFYAAITECKAVLHYCRQQTDAPLLLTGLSMGGQAASIVASHLPFGVTLIAAVAPPTVAEQYAFGHMSTACNWQALAKHCNEQQARQRLKQLIATADIRNFPTPSHSSCYLLQARNDVYIPKSLTQHFIEHWPHAQIQWLNGGHVSSILFDNAKVVAQISQAAG